LTRGFEFSVDALKAANLKDVEAMLDGKRGASAMMHVTRVCGYYADVSNMNKSKVAEIADRGKGNYAFGESLGSMKSPGRAH